MKSVPEDPFENTAQVHSVMDIPPNEDPFAIYGRNVKASVGTLATHSGAPNIDHNQPPMTSSSTNPQNSLAHRVVDIFQESHDQNVLTK